MEFDFPTVGLARPCSRGPCGHRSQLRFGAPSRSQRVVAEFRADASAHLNDPAIHRLVEDLNESSINGRASLTDERG